VEEVEAFQRIVHFAEKSAEVEEVEALARSPSARDRKRGRGRIGCGEERPS
jgi:hypothetical protein